MAYDPVADYFAKTGKTTADLSVEELALLATLNKTQVASLVGIDKKGKGMARPLAVGARGY